MKMNTNLLNISWLSTAPGILLLHGSEIGLPELAVPVRFRVVGFLWLLALDTKFCFYGVRAVP